VADPFSNISRMLDVGPSIRARRTVQGLFAGLVGIWFFAFFGLPALHLVGHKDDHIHLPGGGIVRIAAPTESGSPQESPPDQDRPTPWSHGLGAAAHLSSLALVSPLLIALVGLVQALAKERAIGAPLASPKRLFAWPPACSRGPPLRSFSF
jgi:hypothetical protein